MYLNSKLNKLAMDFTIKIVKAATISILKTTKVVYTKPQQNKELKTLYKLILRLYYRVKSSRFTLYKKELIDTKNLYFNSIKRAKLKYQNQFLEKEDS